MFLKHSAPLIALSLSLVACEAEDPGIDGLDGLEEIDDVDELDEVAQGSDDGDVGPEEDDALVVDVAPGDPVEVADGIIAIAPRPGEGVVMEVLYDDGMTYLADLETDAEGIVRLRLPDLGFADDGLSHACASKCSDTSYKLLGHRWNKRVNWYYRDGGRPSSVGKSGAIAALKYAASTSTGSRNSCGMADQVSATHTYKGTTGTAPNISATSNSVTCTTPDGKNVIGWAGDLPSGTLGVACTWRSDNTAVETDQEYNNKKKWFAGNSVPSGCSDRTSLRAVAAHEWGHSFGLDHSGCKQTMAPSTKPCTSGSRIFGKGDVRGLRALY